MHTAVALFAIVMGVGIAATWTRDLMRGSVDLTSGPLRVGGRRADPARRMFGEAIDVPLPITTFSNGAMVDVIAQPVELRDDVDR